MWCNINTKMAHRKHKGYHFKYLISAKFRHL